jgi:hypothetical protein
MKIMHGSRRGEESWAHGLRHGVKNLPAAAGRRLQPALRLRMRRRPRAHRELQLAQTSNSDDRGCCELCNDIAETVVAAPEGDD